jgi:multicomponent Na+:H+ antiporter subunit D
LLKKLVPEPTISLDLDWVYRMGGRVFLWVARKPVQLADNFVGELYRLAGLVPLMGAAKQAALFDNGVIDGIVDGLASTVRGIGRRLRFAQRGQMQENLAFAFTVAAVLIVAFIIYSNR